MKTLVLALCALALFSYTLTGPARAAAPRNCEGCNFSGADMAGRNFQNVSYVGANFNEANLRNANFSGSKLTGTNFSDADLRGVNFTNVDCTGCSFKGAHLSGAQFKGSRLTGADLSGALDGLNDGELRDILNKCTGCDLRDAQLRGRDLSNIEVTGADMRGADASSARFINAKLIGADFRNANLRNADFTNAAVCWHNTIDRDGTVIQRQTDCDELTGANVAGAKFTGARLCDEAHGSWTCSPVDAGTIRRYSGSTLEGAVLP